MNTPPRYIADAPAALAASTAAQAQAKAESAKYDDARMRRLAEAKAIGAGLDPDSLEQGEPE